METLIEKDQVRAEAVRRDQDRLQGLWNFMSGRREAEFIVCGEHFTMRFRNGDVYVGTFTLDPMSRPRSMDLRIEDGPEAYRGKIALAIYEFDGDHLIWCPAEPGRQDRLVAFPSPTEQDHLCLIFRREKLPE